MLSLAVSEPEQIDLVSLIEHREELPASATVEAAQAAFARSNRSFVAVVNGRELLGVCARRELNQQLGSRFGFALNARHSVRDHLMAHPLRAVAGTRITDVFRSVAARTDEEFYDDVLLVDPQGEYLGMIAMRTLARLQTEFLLGNIARLEASRQEIARKNHEMEEDLQMAREVQLAMQPHHPVTLNAGAVTLRIAHRFQPAGGVSGDFFDVIPLSDHAVGVLVCDVMGHGVRSALVTAMVRAMIEPLRGLAEDPGAFLTRLNRDLTRILRQAGSMIFVTAAYAVFDLAEGLIRYAQAGHPTPLRTAEDGGAFRRLACSPDTEGPALGLMDDFSFVATEEAVPAGQRVVLFTDGVFEAAAPDGEEFGPDRLAAALAKQARLPLDAMLSAVLAEVTDHCRGAPFLDDVCLVAVEVGAASRRVPEPEASTAGGSEADS